MRKGHKMSEATRLVTAEELEKFPDDDYRYELVEGRLIRMSPVGFEHGRIVMRIGHLLQRHLDDYPSGVVLTEVGFKLFANPDTVRAPDIAFIRQERLPPARKGFWHGTPDLAVEVLSPDERPRDVRDKTTEYLTRGVPIVVWVDPDEKAVEVHRPSLPVERLEDDAVLNLDPVVPGFRCRVAEIFA